MKCVAGLIQPQHGSIAAPEEVGFAPQQISALRGYTCFEQVTYAGWLQGLSTGEATQRASTALELVGLAGEVDTKASRLSGGQLKRVGIAEALVASHQLILLDEPTAGLDPEQRHNLRRVLQDVTRAGVQIIVSTHQTDDLAQIYDDVIVLRSGHVRYAGPVQEFLTRAQDATNRAESAYLAVIGGEG